MCSPAIKLSYAMSAYYEFNPVDSSCDFSGNATLNPNSESARFHVSASSRAVHGLLIAMILSEPNTAQDASTAASSCLASQPSGGVYTPTPTTSVAASTSASSGASASGTNRSGSNSSSSAGEARYGIAFLARGWIGGVVGVVGVFIGGAVLL